MERLQGFGNLRFTETENRLIIEPVDRDHFLEEIHDWENCSSLESDIELLREMDGIFSPCCNGWDIIPPEEVGALVSDDTILLSQEKEEDDQGNIVSLGKLYYQTLAHHGSLVDQIIEKGYAVLNLS